MVVEATNADNTADFSYWQAVYKSPTATNIIAQRASLGTREEIQPLADGEQQTAAFCSTPSASGAVWYRFPIVALVTLASLWAILFVAFSDFN